MTLFLKLICLPNLHNKIASILPFNRTMQSIDITGGSPTQIFIEVQAVYPIQIKCRAGQMLPNNLWIFIHICKPIHWACLLSTSALACGVISRKCFLETYCLEIRNVPGKQVSALKKWLFAWCNKVLVIGVIRALWDGARLRSTLPLLPALQMGAFMHPHDCEAVE